MIGRIAGTLLVKKPPQVLVDVAGVGYEVDVPMSTFFNLPALGQPVILLTHFVVREDAQLLYGFLTDAERSTFRTLLRVSGVGPKVALAVLSGMSVDDLVAAVALQEASRLTKVPGIGKKTAERLLLELKDKLGQLQEAGVGAGTARTPSTSDDVQEALLGLGYGEREAIAAVRQLPTGLSVSDGLRHALKLLSGAKS